MLLSSPGAILSISNWDAFRLYRFRRSVSETQRSLEAKPLFDLVKPIKAAIRTRCDRGSLRTILTILDSYISMITWLTSRKLTGKLAESSIEESALRASSLVWIALLIISKQTRISPLILSILPAASWKALAWISYP